MIDFELSLPQLRVRAYEGSSWCALLVAIQTSPTSLTDLLRIVNIGRPVRVDKRTFDAICDAYAMYEDAMASGVPA